MSDPLSEVLNVRLEHRVHHGLLLDISLRLGREIGIVFGRSGAGKTTLLRLIAGLITPAAGTIRLDGATVLDTARRVNLPLRSRRIGMIFQDDCLFPHLNVAANIRFGLRGWPRQQAEGRIAHVAALCGVENLVERYPETLSGGERQRVGLARALAPRPRLLLCDEPVSALDMANRHALLERLRAVQHDEGIPMLYVTHSPAEAITLGSRLFLLEHGRIVSEGPPSDVLSAPGGISHQLLASEGVRNVISARVANHSSNQRESRLDLDNGPELIVPFLNKTVGTRVTVEIRAEDIILAHRPLGSLSARNQIPGVIERIVPHGTDAEAIVRTGGLTWIVSVVAETVDHLKLAPGVELILIVKARSCHVLF